MCKISLNKAILREWIISQKIYYWGASLSPSVFDRSWICAAISWYSKYYWPPFICQASSYEVRMPSMWHTRVCYGRAYSSQEQTRRSLGITGRNNTVWIVSVNGGGCYFRWKQRCNRREISSETLAGQQSEWLQCKYISHKSKRAKYGAFLPVREVGTEWGDLRQTRASAHQREKPRFHSDLQ